MRARQAVRAGVAALAGIILVTGRAWAQATSYEQLQAFSSVLSQVRANYVDSVETGYLVRSAIVGMLEGLDPHSHYTSRQDHDLRTAWLDGQLGSPGIVLENGDGAPVVLSVRRDSPAWKAGVQPGDRVLSVSDTVVGGLSAQQVELRLIGEKGSRVHVKLARGTRLNPDTVSVRLKRAVLEAKAVSMVRMVDATTGYVRLDEFLPGAPKELDKALGQLKDKRMSQLILDLRGNPGGSVQAMIDIASLFLPKGTELLRASGRRKTGIDREVVKDAGNWQKLPMVVLIDGGSASASEMLAGALQDHDRAVIVGRRSFGKALMQTSLPVSNGDVVWLTVARVLTPSGRVIQRRYQGLNVEQYYAGAGKGGDANDTMPEYRTAKGRTVRGGGGIRPDVERPSTALPAWLAAASDTGLLVRIADSVALTLGTTPEAQARWQGDAAAWEAMAGALQAQAATTLGIKADAEPAARATVGRFMAGRTAEVRWGVDAGDAFRLANDPDVQLGLAQFPRMAAILGG